MDPPTESWDHCVFVDLSDFARVGGRLWRFLFGVLFHKLCDISGVQRIITHTEVIQDNTHVILHTQNNYALGIIHIYVILCAMYKRTLVFWYVHIFPTYEQSTVNFPGGRRRCKAPCGVAQFHQSLPGTTTAASQ